MVETIEKDNGGHSTMVDEKPNAKASFYKKSVEINDNSGELKTQFTIDLTEYDTSEMDGYKEGDPVYKGFTCKLATLKPNKTKPRTRIDIDPTNKEIRKAIGEMYATYDSLVK